MAYNFRCKGRSNCNKICTNKCGHFRNCCSCDHSTESWTEIDTCIQCAGSPLCKFSETENYIRAVKEYGIRKNGEMHGESLDRMMRRLGKENLTQITLQEVKKYYEDLVNERC